MASKKNYRCPYCNAVNSLMAVDWCFDVATQTMDYSNGYICGNCSAKIPAMRVNGKIQPRDFDKFTDTMNKLITATSQGLDAQVSK